MRTPRLPIVTWITAYRREDLHADVLAGGAVWALVVPQSVTYATLAGVPVQHGLYAMIAALVVYAVFGPSSRVIAGISATTVSLTPLVIAAVTHVEGDELVAYSAATSLAVGCILLAMGGLRMGWVANFLSAPVVAGFITGFGISLAIDQLPKMLGYPAETNGAIRQLWLVIRHLDETQGATFVVGATSLVVLFGLRRTRPRCPGASSRCSGSRRRRCSTSVPTASPSSATSRAACPTSGCRTSSGRSSRRCCWPRRR